ncbi:hypothetical protein [uncultured Metabacillus sp.]|uniref:hypothetical protein n=1 Tax=uncultured Metabacillus sp. TaxID=2860135 RepID=UPI002621CD97|nr:hypothetical protein [uncultured Metabacillus sp.]
MATEVLGFCTGIQRPDVGGGWWGEEPRGFVFCTLACLPVLQAKKPRRAHDFTDVKYSVLYFTWK